MTPTPDHQSTPATDALLSSIQSVDLDTGGQLIALTDFARILERRLRAANAELASLRASLEDIRSRSSINFVMRSDQFELTARLGDIHQIADAALAQETKA